MDFECFKVNLSGFQGVFQGVKGVFYVYFRWFLRGFGRTTRRLHEIDVRDIPLGLE